MLSVKPQFCYFNTKKFVLVISVPAFVDCTSVGMLECEECLLWA